MVNHEKQRTRHLTGSHSGRDMERLVSCRELLKLSCIVAVTGLAGACLPDGDDDDEPTSVPSPTPAPEDDWTDDDPEPDPPTPTPDPEATPTREPEPTPTAPSEPDAFDLIIRGGEILDGSRDERFTADVGIQGDRIAVVGDLSGHPAGQVIDASGLFVAPGFINTHSHIEEWIEEGRPLTPSLLQGVTSEIAGMDGESPLNIAEHLDAFEAADLEVNYGTVIGHAAVRRAVLGDGPVQPDQGQLEQMRELVERGMSDGAFGFSTGLEYVPGMYASSEEIIALAGVAADHDAIYNTHIRDEGRDIVEAVQEAIDVGRQTGITLVITHLKVRRAPGWSEDPQMLLDLTDAVIELLHDSREDGIDVWADLYPYTTTWGSIGRQLSEVIGQHPPDHMIVSEAEDPQLVDRRVAGLAEEWNLTIEDAVDRLLAEEPDVRVAVERTEPESIKRFLAQEFTMVAIDNPVGTGRWSHPAGDILHPRTFGTYPRLLGQYVRDEGVLEWEEAVHRSSGLPATLYDIEDRGFVREGYFADLVIIDPETIRDRTTHTHPERHPEGIEHVLVNGEIAVTGGKLVPVNDEPDAPHRMPGRVLRRS
jgi:N-acyl-D-amino-acid deacylase